MENRCCVFIRLADLRGEAWLRSQNFISSLKICILRLEIYIFRLEIHISRLEVWAYSASVRFFCGLKKLDSISAEAGSVLEIDSFHPV